MADEKRESGAQPDKIHRTRDRDFGTVRNAIAHGMNVGAYGITNLRLRNPSYHWRLVGDRVEHKLASAERWSWMCQTDLDRPFSRGVYGRRVRFCPQILLHEVVQQRLCPATQEPGAEEPSSVEAVDVAKDSKQVH